MKLVTVILCILTPVFLYLTRFWPHQLIRHSTDYRVAQKSKSLPNYQKIMLNRIKVCQWD